MLLAPAFLWWCLHWPDWDSLSTVSGTGSGFPCATVFFSGVSPEGCAPRCVSLNLFPFHRSVRC